MSFLQKTAVLVFFGLNLTFAAFGQPCPTLNNNATLTSPDCTQGVTTCDVCPGDVITLTATGDNLQPGDCVNWYYSPTPNFNPYNGEGTLLGCAQIETTPPSPCNGCPLTLGLFVDACGNEPDNEFIALYSGTGFFVDQLVVDFDASANAGGGNGDIGIACAWQTPDPNAIASIQTFCAGANVIGVGPGESVPPGVPVVIFTSAGYSFNYNFGSLCPLAPTIYVMQNGCTRTSDAFPQSGGSISTTISVNCGCSQTTTYNTGNLLGGDGAFVTDAGFPNFYGNVGCGFPAFPGIPGNPMSPIQIPPLDVTITQDMCNGGPYYVVGVIEPLPGGCAQTFTNYLEYDVPCPDPTLGTANVCENGGLFDLNTIEDPAYPDGIWSGPGVSGTNFDPSGQFGMVNLEFTPTGPCSSPTPTTVTIIQQPTATFAPVVSACPGTEIDLIITFAGTGPFTFDLLEDGVILGTFTEFSTTYQTMVSPTTTTTYSIENFSDANCTGDNASFTLNVLPAPSASLSLVGPSSVCVGDSTFFEINIAGGSAPYTFEYSLNGVLQPPVTTLLNPFSFPIEINDTTIVALESLVANGCPAAVSGTFTINTTDPVTADISGGGQICQGGSGTDLTVTFTGTGPYTFTYTADGVVQPTVTTSDNPYVFNVNPSSGTIYKLTSVTNGSCPGTVSGMAVVFVFTPSTAVISGDQTVCDSASTTVEIDFTGTGPFTIEWAIDGVPQPPVDTFEDPFLIPVNVDTTTIYTLVSVQSPGCTGSVNGSATITVNYAPTFQNVMINCNPANLDYTVEFDVEGAALPLTLFSGMGQFMGSHFVSDPIHQDSAYSFSFFDVNMCDTLVVAGPSICNCITEAGTMLTDTSNWCPGNTAVGVFNNDEVLDASDSLRFIIHENPGVPLGQIYGWNSIPEFGLLPGMVEGQTYYISAIAGDYAGMDSIDLADPCISVASGTPVIFRPAPNAVFSFTDTTICIEDTIVLPIIFSGSQPYSLSYSIDGFPFPPISQLDSDTLELTIVGATDAEYILEAIDDAFCSDLFTDTFNLTVITRPQISNLDIDCDLQTQTYVLQFDVSGGTPPYNIAGISGNLVGNQFTSDPQASSIDYSVVLTDAAGCGQDSIGGEVVCNCFSFAGSFIADTIGLCEGDTAFAPFQFDQTLDLDDTLVFVLFEGPDPFTGTILDLQDSPEFSFMAGVTQPGTVYHVASLAGNHNGGLIDPADPCLSVSNFVPVIWRLGPTASLSGMHDICPGGNQLIQITFTGTPPYNFSYTQNGSLNNNIALSNTFTINSTLLETTVFELVSVSDQHCPGTAVGTAEITVHGVPEIDNVMVSCNDDNLTYSVSFEVSGEDSTDFQFSGNLLGVFDPLTGIFTSDSMPLPNGFNVYVEDSWQCGIDSVVQTPSCPCNTFVGNINPDALDICEGTDIVFDPVSGTQLDGFDSLLYVLFTDPADISGSIQDVQPNPGFAWNPAWQAGQTLYFAAVAGNPSATTGINFNDPCLSVTTIQEAIIRPLPEITLSGDTSVCAGGIAIISIQQTTGTPPYTFTYSIDNGAPQPPVTSGTGSYMLTITDVNADQSIQLLSVEDDYCVGTATGEFTISTLPQPEFMVGIQEERLCPGDTAFLNVSLLNADSVRFDLIEQPGVLFDTYMGMTNGTQIAIVPTDTTSFDFGNIVISGNDCPPALGIDANIYVSPMTLSLDNSDFNGFGVSCAGLGDGWVSANITGGFPPVTGMWNTGDTGFDLTDVQAGAYTLTLTDSINCTISAAVELSEPLALDFLLETIDGDCVPGATGELIVQQVQNVVGNSYVQVNTGPVVLVDSFPYSVVNLPEDDYTVILSDDNGCTTSQQTFVWIPDGIEIDLPAQFQIKPGDSVLLDPIITGGGLVAFSWTPTLSLSDPTELQTWAMPDSSIFYTIQVQDNAGCFGEATVEIIVEQIKRVFIPNTIRIDAGDNGSFTVYGGNEVLNVSLMQVYDRWGGLMYEGVDLELNNPGSGWDGFWNGKPVLPGVYPYIIEVEYVDGTDEVFIGELTVVR